MVIFRSGPWKDQRSGPGGGKLDEVNILIPKMLERLFRSEAHATEALAPLGARLPCAPETVLIPAVSGSMKEINLRSQSGSEECDGDDRDGEAGKTF